MRQAMPENTSPIFLFTDLERQSYAAIGRLYRLTLESMGLEVYEIQTPKTDYQSENAFNEARGHMVLQSTIGPLFKPVPGAMNIAVPWHEWSRYPWPWVERLNKFDGVWVTTDHMRVLLEESRITTPVHFMPPALDIDHVPEKKDWQAGDIFRFFSCGEPHFRKGFHLLMEGFMLAFPELGIASLTIKTSPECAWKPPRKDITIVAENMKRNDLLAMYSKFDAYVSASLAEGLGLPVAEAVRALLPVATNFWGGHKSILNEGAFWLIDHDEVDQPYCSDPSYYAPGQKCALSHPEEIAETLKAIVESTSALRKEKAMAAREHFLGEYGTQAAHDRLRKHLSSF